MSEREPKRLPVPDQTPDTKIGLDSQARDIAASLETFFIQRNEEAAKDWDETTEERVKIWQESTEETKRILNEIDTILDSVDDLPSDEEKKTAIGNLIQNVFIDEEWSECFAFETSSDEKKAKLLDQMILGLIDRLNRALNTLSRLEFDGKADELRNIFNKIPQYKIFELIPIITIEDDDWDIDDFGDFTDGTYLSWNDCSARRRAVDIFHTLAKGISSTGQEGQQRLLEMLAQQQNIPELGRAEKYFRDKQAFSIRADGFKNMEVHGERAMNHIFYDLQAITALDTTGPHLIEMNRAILETLSQTDDDPDKIVDNILNWLEKDITSTLSRNELALALGKLNTNLAIQKLIDLHNNTDKYWLKELSTFILYRIENRDLEIDEEGVSYLGQHYDLGELNRPENIACRLTNDGKVGIFNEDRELSRYFENANPYEDNESTITPELHQLTVEDIFYPEAKQNSETQHLRQEAFNNFVTDYYGGLRAGLYLDTGLYLSNYSLREQGSFVMLFHRLNDDEQYRLSQFISMNGEDGFRSLGMLQDERIGFEALMNFSKVYDHERTRQVFAEYARTIQSTEWAAGDICDAFFVNSDDKKVDRQTVTRELIRRANDAMAVLAVDLHSRYSNNDAVRRAMLDGDWGKVDAKTKYRRIDINEVQKTINQVQQENALFSAVFRAAFKGQKEVDFENIRGVEFGSKPATWMSKEEKVEMLTTFEESWKADLPEAVGFAKTYFDKALNDKEKNARFTVMRKDGKVAAFARIEKEAGYESGHVHAGSLVVAPEFHGSAMGEALWRKVVDDAARNNVVHAEFFPETDAGTMYVERAGFVVDGVERVDLGDGEPKRPLLRMIRDDRANAEYASRAEGLTDSDIMRWADGGAPEGIEVKRFDFSGGRDEFVGEIERQSAEGLAMTRYFADPRNRDVRYATFERQRNELKEIREKIKKAA